ncbi:MAG: glycosyltransferase [Candidatus Caenarcaniphilales bacterium]|nr:glycosyltransferase [Candidatus Caenarcaniphilales bacterium]
MVVDNASNDGTEEKLREEFGETITLIQTGANLGGSGGFNTGMKFAMEYHDNEYIWLVDNDAVGSMILQLDNPESITFHESMNQKQPIWIRYYNIRNLLYTYAKFKPLRLPLVFLKFFLGAFYFLFHGLKKNTLMKIQLMKIQLILF